MMGSISVWPPGGCRKDRGGGLSNAPHRVDTAVTTQSRRLMRQEQEVREITIRAACCTWINRHRALTTNTPTGKPDPQGDEKLNDNK